KAACGRQDLGACSGPKPAPALGSGAIFRRKCQPFYFLKKGCFLCPKGLTVNPLAHIIEPMMNDETGAVKAGFPN
ncbi:hypothetical protein, partial [Burkholderia cenocepacia]|uniref:hypothetical protein n=1 Tax=Burkholderia cenocepacia TaxID=95486 RepID=UPI0022313D13